MAFPMDALRQGSDVFRPAHGALLCHPSSPLSALPNRRPWIIHEVAAAAGLVRQSAVRSEYDRLPGLPGGTGGAPWCCSLKLAPTSAWRRDS